MKILHVTTSLAYSWGGPPRVVVPLAEALVNKGVRCTIVAPYFPVGEPMLDSDIIEIKVFRVGWLAKYWNGYSLDLARNLYRLAEHFDLIHIHEPWHFPNVVAYAAAKSLGKPYGVTLTSKEVHFQLSRNTST